MLNLLIPMTLAALATAGAAQAASSLESILGNSSIDVIVPGDSGYYNASLAFNRRLHFEPSAIAYPNSTEDVAWLIKNLGEPKGIPVNARSGGHSYAAYGLGGADGHLVIDLSRINHIHFDNTTNHAIVGAGNRLGNVASTLYNISGHALPHGTCPLVGLGGHASFGGFGFTSRMWGLNLDNIVNATVVLANGTIVEASIANHSDLFWALRGAAPSFGIMTQLTYKTYVAPAQPTFFSYEWSLPLKDAIQGIMNYQNFSANGSIPPEFGVELNLRKGNNTGEITLNLIGSFYGLPEDFKGIVAPFLAQMPNQPVSRINVTSWLDNLRILGEGVPLESTPMSIATDNNTFYAKSLTTPSNESMSTEAITALANWLSVEGWYTTTDWFVQLQLYGGSDSKINQVAANATAYFNRGNLWTIQMYTSSADHKPPFPREGFAFLDGIVAAITANEPESYRYGAYPNYVDPRLPAPELYTLYYGSNYQRLREIKTDIDPANLFRWPQSIPLDTSVQAI